MSIRSVLIGTMMCGAVALAGIARAQEQTPKAEENLLAGPQVEQEAEAKVGGMMGEERRGMAGRRAEIPPQPWFAQLRGLDLSDDQVDSIRAIMQEFHSAQRAFMESLTDEEREELRQLGPMRGETPNLNRRQRELLARMEANRPAPEPYQRRIWDELSPQQQEEFKGRLDALRERMMDRRDERREGRDQMMAPPPPPPPPSARELPGAPDMSPEPRRGREVRRGDMRGLDEMAQRRIRFLLSRQSRDAADQSRRLDGAPTERDRRFRFDEDEPLRQ